jgi:hypothetical protein
MIGGRDAPRSPGTIKINIDVRLCTLSWSLTIYVNGIRGW